MPPRGAFEFDQLRICFLQVVVDCSTGGQQGLDCPESAGSLLLASLEHAQLHLKLAPPRFGFGLSLQYLVVAPRFGLPLQYEYRVGCLFPTENNQYGRYYSEYV